MFSGMGDPSLSGPRATWQGPSPEPRAGLLSAFAFWARGSGGSAGMSIDAQCQCQRRPLSLT
jgi:hypothetical protein